MSTTVDSVKAAVTVSPAESEIAAIAYQLWLDKGCPIGSDQEDWFQAEAMLKSGLVLTCEDQFRESISCSETRPKPAMLAELPWEGHWEIWEREWYSARWVWDRRGSRVGVPSQAFPSGKAA